MAHARRLAVQGRLNDRLARGLIVARFSPPSGGDLPNLPDTLLAHPLAPQLHRGAAHFQCRSDRHIVLPRQAAKIIRQRSATCCGVPCEASHCSSCVRSGACNLIAGLVFGMTTILPIAGKSVTLFTRHYTSSEATALSELAASASSTKKVPSSKESL